MPKDDVGENFAKISTSPQSEITRKIYEEYNPVIAEVLAPVDQEYVYPDFPPEALTWAFPSHMPLQDASVGVIVVLSAEEG